MDTKGISEILASQDFAAIQQQTTVNGYLDYSEGTTQSEQERISRPVRRTTRRASQVCVEIYIVLVAISLY